MAAEIVVFVLLCLYQEFEMAAEIRHELNQQIFDKVGQVRKQMAWEQEKSRLSLHKIRARYTYLQNMPHQSLSIVCSIFNSIQFNSIQFNSIQFNSITLFQTQQSTYSKYM